MWAGGRLIFRAPLRLGEWVRRVSTIRSIEQKKGRSGELLFVTVCHALSGSDGVAIEEEQDLVYREDARAAPPAQAQQQEANDPVDGLLPDAVLLFRYSALTMNSHRIHYDQPYATEVENYPALVVHGPLQATLLAALGERLLGARVSAFRFRGLAPAFAGERLDLYAEQTDEGFDLWTSQGGSRRMTACAQK